MKEVINFFEDFLETGYQCLLSRWNKDVTSEQHDLIYQKYSSNFLNTLIMDSIHDKWDGLYDGYSNEDIQNKYNKVRRRKLYMVREYVAYELGVNLKDKVNLGSKLYRCYVSSDSVFEGEELSFISESYFAMDTDEGFKIIYRTYFSDGGWKHSTHSDEQVLSVGKAVETMRLEEPVEEESRQVYYSEEDTPITEFPR